MEDTDPAQRIIQLIQQAAIATAPVAALAGGALPPILVVVGNGNIVGAHSAATPTAADVPVPLPKQSGTRAVRHEAKANGSISRDQAAEIEQLVAQWVEQVRQSGVPSFGVDLAWAEFVEAMGTRTYLHLDSASFAMAVDWLHAKITSASKLGIQYRLGRAARPK